MHTETIHARSAHEARVAASPVRAYEALRDLRVTDLPLTGLLGLVRELPVMLTGRRPRISPGAGRLVDGAVSLGFVVLRDEPGRALELGVAGRPWRVARPDVVPLADAGAFERFDAPGYVKARWVWRFIPDGDGAIVRTATLVTATDEAARRSFLRYWWVIRHGSGLIRLDILRALRRRCRS